MVSAGGKNKTPRRASQFNPLTATGNYKGSTRFHDVISDVGRIDVYSFAIVMYELFESFPYGNLIKRNFPLNPTLQRAKLMDNNNFRLNVKELNMIERHQNPYKPSPFKGPQDQIQKPQKKHQLHEKKFGRIMHHPHVLHKRMY